MVLLNYKWYHSNYKQKSMLYLIFFVLLFTSCSDCRSNAVDKYKVIDFFKSENRIVYVDEIFDEITIFPLETSQNCLLDECPRILGITDTTLILSNMFNKIYVFSKKTGRFLYEVGKQGNGPDEYLLLDGTGVFNKSGQLVYANQGNKWIGMNVVDNQIKDRVKKPNLENWGSISGIVNLYRISDSLYISYINNLDGNAKYRLVTFDRNGKVLKYYPNTLMYNYKNKSVFPACNGNFYFYKDELYFYGGILIDTLYKVNADSIVPCFAFNLNKKKFPYERFGEQGFESWRYMSLQNVMEYPAKLLFTYQGDEFGRGFGYYDKMLDKTVLSLKEDEGVRFKQEKLPSYYPYYMDESGYTIGFWTAYQWLDFVEKQEDPFLIPDNLKNVKYDDNPILVVARVKK